MRFRIRGSGLILLSNLLLHESNTIPLTRYNISKRPQRALHLAHRARVLSDEVAVHVQPFGRQADGDFGVVGHLLELLHRAYARLGPV